ncbi:RIP metalloprotease RseP [uncultured Muribaculum sp.]|uniref:RIP metalloprotease RseP n=1 Tax=uncultured Muribaculum sp. TaxID=1918613 RepID=UPI00272F03DF|nr:RIP metalloprotease RseP [uncultured Muribaculum sp.]
METFLIKAAQLIAAFALLVIIHEFGHYIFARMFGIKVEKFYLFFDPWFSLFKYKPKKKTTKTDPNGEERATWRDTEYGIGWLPLGGYVKIAGMIDESMDKEQLAQEPKSWEFRSKPAYQRLLVMVAGVLMNFILAIIIYAGIAWYWGEKYIPLDKAYEGMDYAEAAQEIGFRNGDIPLFADGEKLEVAKGNYLLEMAEAKTVTVLRNHKDTVDIAIPENFILRLNDEERFLTYRLPVYIGDIVNGEPAKEAGLQKGDRIVSVAGAPTLAYTEFTAELQKNAGKDITMGIIRDGKPMDVAITPTSGGKIGIQLKPITDIYPVVTRHYTFLQSIPKGWEIGTNRLSSYVSSMKYVATAEGAKSLGGFGAIGSLFPDKWNWLSFWEITAFLSVALAFMNILPIPTLDGGHIMFLIYEIVSRRKPSEKFMEYAQICGMAFLLVLLLYANGNDLYRFIFK